MKNPGLAVSAALGGVSGTGVRVVAKTLAT